MKAKEAVIKLAGRFDIEAPHTRHVTRLALELFDGFSPVKGLKKGDRPILFAAAALHDIGYASNPQDHVKEGARLLAAHRIDAFATGEWKLVIGVVLLHQRDWRAALGHEAFPALSTKALERAKKLAAFLRIADGLDHGHIQDARITYCRRGKRADKVGVECKWYAGNITWAEGKADLWEAVHGRPFRFEGNVKQSKKMFKGVVHNKDSALSAARRILYSQWCVMRDQWPRMREGCEIEGLHAYRTALRRFGTALRLFRPLLEETVAADLNRRMKVHSADLGPIWDAHATLCMWEKLCPDPQQYPEVGARFRAEVASANKALRAVIDSEEQIELAQCINRFLRIELPRLEKQQPEPTFVPYVQKVLKLRINDLHSVDVSALRTVDSDGLDAFRRDCRRLRDYAEFASPVLGREIQRSAKHLKRLAMTLDEVSDIRALANVLRELPFYDALPEAENMAWEHVDEEWKKFTSCLEQLQ